MAASKQWKPPGLHQGMTYATIGGYTLFRAMRPGWFRWSVFWTRQGLSAYPLAPRSRQGKRLVYRRPEATCP